MIESQNNANDVRLQFITFISGEQEYGANIMTIREIRGWTDTTLLPHAPEYVRGVINLRGVVLPVVDLKGLLGYGLTEANSKQVIIVVNAGTRTLGLLVDAVSDILTAKASEIQPTPELARDATCSFIEGIAVLDKRMVTLLSMEKLTASLAGSAEVAEAA